MSSWHSPQSIYNLGHAAVKELFTVPVQVQEKVDGSFFAFGLYETEPAGSNYRLTESDKDFLRRSRITQDEPKDLELKVRSKGAMMIPDAPQAMFKTAVEAVKERLSLLRPGWQYRGEVVAKPKHNSLHYDRTPKDFIILFDVCTGEEQYLNYEDLTAEAQRLGFEVVPQLYSGIVNSAEELRKFLDRESILGGQKIEGVVVKPLNPLYGPDKKMLFGKFVSEAFKEVHRKAWGESNPGPKDIISQLGDMYGTPQRYQKAVMHLRERGLLEDSPRDIGMLVKEVPADVLKECEDEIKEALWKYAWPHISRIIIKQLPLWYKDQLLIQQFEKEAGNV